MSDGLGVQVIRGVPVEKWTEDEAELFVGAALFTSAGDLFSKHSPTRLMANPDYVEATQLLAKMKKEYAPIVDILNKKKARLEILGHGLTLYLSERMATYERLRAQLVD